MAKSQPKKYINPVKLRDNIYGKSLRYSYSQTITENAPIFPKPLNYEDIDKEMFNFVDKILEMTIKDNIIPTYTLYSNQRFSEYSQTWQHTDEEGNLLMNFKTISRETNPKTGTNQGGYWNIPGDRKYTLLIKDVLDDNGKESYEIYSMKQPYCVDLTYRISIITDMFENLNTFNEIVHDKFKARQCYIRPNGHYIPMVLEDVTDNTEYTISDRKFYNQTVSIKVMAYIINEKDFTIEKKPKNVKLFMEGDTKRPKPTVNIEEYFKDKLDYASIDLTIDFEEWHDKVKFEIDTDFVVNSISYTNVRNMRLSINNTPYYIDKGFKLKNGDVVNIVIKHIDPSLKSQVLLEGYNPSKPFIKNELPINAKDDPEKFDFIQVD